MADAFVSADRERESKGRLLPIYINTSFPAERVGDGRRATRQPKAKARRWGTGPVRPVYVSHGSPHLTTPGLCYMEIIVVPRQFTTTVEIILRNKGRRVVSLLQSFLIWLILV